MALNASPHRSGDLRLPRASGDGPSNWCGFAVLPWVAPRERGWPLLGPAARGVIVGCPARAGMALPGSAYLGFVVGLPRASGDGPCSHCTHAVSQGLPRASGDGPGNAVLLAGISMVAPRERGWPRQGALVAVGLSGCPARAGMARISSSVYAGTPWLPRASGDGPHQLDLMREKRRVAPRERGWPRIGRRVAALALGCPARAGMAPPSPGSGRGHCRLPRASGDGPSSTRARNATRPVAPRERGWPPPTQVDRGIAVGCPARAGMAPQVSPAEAPRGRLPRASGDGPVPGGRYSHESAVAPRERGWPSGYVDAGGHRHGCPARAGMAPVTAGRSRPSRRLPRRLIGNSPTCGVCPLCVRMTLMSARAAVSSSKRQHRNSGIDAAAAATP